ncbi:protein-serine O-palmitoleoyltransferase porcupine [Sitophilus oryzae]|uniref:Protein-serine O-palmitoleoyltransferase porcupine n=1 Tax=Sitophilus oryzae TaxID=7048 RepID=A0A6J2XYE9_SITOR|nr:protein-serine O-palmitoleoyltransferase porcupine [Sitophilus oryzae]
MVDYLPDIYTSDESLQYYTNEFEDIFQESFQDVWENCVLESVKSIYNSMYLCLIVNVAFGLITSLGLPEILFHWLSAMCGVYILVITLQSTKTLMVIYLAYILTYLIIIVVITLHKRLNQTKPKEDIKRNTQIGFIASSSVVQYSLIIIFVLFEYILLDKEEWLEIRGIMMVFSMKLISLVTDQGMNDFPSFSEYCGYMFSNGNILFGPWISYENYMYQMKYPTRKNIFWVLAILRALFLAVFFLSVSNCWASYLISDNSNRLLLGYKEALSFRTSHYFICYLSEALILAAGWKDNDYHFDTETWTLSVTDPWQIEFPTALSIVVINWNKPMHAFFKKYIYRKWLPLGKFYAVFVTFLISSLFHGFEIKVSLVLISLGIFSYLQVLVRDYISQTFNMCVKIYPCKSCNHKIRPSSILCTLTKLIFSLLTVLDLIYLGVLMDQSTDEVGIYTKWNNLYFCSFWIMLINFLIVK